MLLLVVAVLAVSYASSTRAWLRQRGELNQLNADIAAQQAQVAELQQEKRRLHDPAYIRTQARLRFGWVMPGETGYRVIGDDGEVMTDSGGSLSQPVDTTPASDPEWWDSAWGSVVEAGDEPETETADTHDPATTGSGAGPAGHIGRDGREGATGSGSGSGRRGGADREPGAGTTGNR